MSTTTERPVAEPTFEELPNEPTPTLIPLESLRIVSA